MFFNKKQKVNLDEFCRDFYENIILNPVIGGTDVSAVFYDTSRRSIVEADPSFANIDPKKFSAEIRILQFELFALAWMDKFGDKSAVAQSIFTNRYLHENERDDIWDAMESYNQAIAHSVTVGKNSNGRLSKAIEVGSTGFIYRMRADLYDVYQKQGFDTKCVARAVNRILFGNAWKKGYTAYFLMLTLCDHLGFKPDEPSEAQMRLTFVIRMIYDGARQSLDKIKIKS